MTQTFRTRGESGFEWMMPDAEKHFISMLEIDPEYQSLSKAMIIRNKTRIDLSHVLDVGANIGLWTRWFARQGSELIDCFEPMDDNLECLRANVNDLPMVRIYDVALSDQPGTLVLHTTHDNKNGGAASIDPFGELRKQEDHRQHTVGCDTLDSLGLAPTFIKIDIQGAEPLMLAGSERTIKSHKPGICVECDYPDLDPIKLLESWGYEVIERRKSDFLMLPK